MNITLLTKPCAAYLITYLEQQYSYFYAITLYLIAKSSQIWWKSKSNTKVYWNG